MFSEVILDQKFFLFWADIRRDNLTFMLIGVFSSCGKILLAHSPNAFIFFERILHARYIRRRLCTHSNIPRLIIEQHEKTLVLS
jgi:hypothetical protein